MHSAFLNISIQQSASVFKAGIRVLAQLFTILIHACLITCSVPWQLKGGRLCPLHEKGPADEWEKHRGITVTDHATKVVTKTTRPPVAKAVEEAVLETQVGGKKGGSTLFASHTSNTFLAWAKAKGLCAAILFLDLKQAFDRFVREIALGFPEHFDPAVSVGL